MVTAVLFDMDGLMFDTEVLHYHGWKMAGKRQGFELPHDLLMRVKGSAKNIGNAMLREAVEGFNPEVAREEKTQYVLDYIDKNGVPVKPGLEKLLQFLNERKIKCAVASSTKEELVKKFLEMTNLTQYFDTLVCGGRVTHGKPAPDIFLEAARMVGEDPTNCIVLEDSINGIQAGHAAGCHVIMVPDQIPATDELRAMTDRVIGRLDDLIDIFDEI